MKKIFVIMAMVISLMSSVIYAGEVDILVNKLAEKGVVTDGEAQQILTETKEEIRKQVAKGESVNTPQWVQDIKFKGDFRTRYQLDKAFGKPSDDRDRERIRVRFGAETRMIENIKVGFGVATGTIADPKSTNATLTDSFAFKTITLDYGYAQYTCPSSGVTITTGKFKNPIWEPIDILWDTDINPEGVALQLSNNITPSVELFLNYGYFLIQENNFSSGITTQKDAGMSVIEPGANWKISENVNLKAAADFYSFYSLKENPIYIDYQKSNSGTENTDKNGKKGYLYKYNFNSFNPKFELGINDPFAGLDYIALVGEYLKNNDSEDAAHAIGVKFGSPKVANVHDWQFAYNYRVLEKDSWIDILPDSDFRSGKTNAKGYKASMVYGLTKNSTLNFAYFDTEDFNKTGATANPAQILQIDWVVKF
ncbi:putative porin [Candidatus Poribacteria bacterium]|nr:putative porin [Candidatus Poribacteria bacterium]